MKTPIALVLCFLSMFIFGGLWNAVIFEGTYISLSPDIVRPLEEFNFGIIFATNAIFTGIIYFIGKSYFSEFTIKSLLAGAVIGFISVQPALTNLYAKWDFSFTYLLLDTVYAIVLGALGMLVFCRLYFRKSKQIEVRNVL